MRPHDRFSANGNEKNGILNLNFCLFQGLVAGTTVVCALYRPVEKRLYVGWVGDSKAMLVSENRMMQIVTPHKPDNEVSSRVTRYISNFVDQSVCRPSPPQKSARALTCHSSLVFLFSVSCAFENRTNEYESKRVAAVCSR